MHMREPMAHISGATVEALATATRLWLLISLTFHVRRLLLGYRRLDSPASDRALSCVHISEYPPSQGGVTGLA